MIAELAKYRTGLLLTCLLAALGFAVVYDMRWIVDLPELRALVALAVMGCLAGFCVLAKWPREWLQTALLAGWPLHLFTISFLGICWCFLGGNQLTAILAYTVVAYAAWLLVPLCLAMDRRLFDAFVKMVAVVSGLLAIAGCLGAVGVDSLLGLPLSNKYFYSTFSGFVASGGVFEHPEGQALQMAIGLFCCLYAFHRTGSWIYAGCFLLVLAGLIISQGRGAIFGVAVAVAVWFLPPVFRRSRVVFVGSLTLCLVFPFLIWPQLAAIPGVSDYLRFEQGLSGRETAWRYASELIEERPWTGFGFGSSGLLTEDAKDIFRDSGYSGAGTTFHNTFVTRAVELGLVSAVLYGLLYLVPLLRICEPSRYRHEQDLIRSVMIVVLTASVFRDYNIGGVRSTALIAAVFLGLGNLWPIVHRLQTASRSVTRKGTWEEPLTSRSQVVAG
jgi:O-antigen ligase